MAAETNRTASDRGAKPLALRCEMTQRYRYKGRGAFDPVTTPRTRWAPSPDHYPILKSAGGHLVPEDVRLSHVWCNNRD